MATEAEGLESVIPCEVCQASIPTSQYIQHAQAHATLVIPDEYKPFTQKQGNENWLNNEGATGYLKPELNIKQRLKQRKHLKTTIYGYAHENCDNIVPNSILQIVISYHDTFYINILETGFIFDILEQTTGNSNNIGQRNILKVVFNGNKPIRVESTPFTHCIEWKNIKFVCNDYLTPIFKEIFDTNKTVIENKSCFSIVGTNYIFDCITKDELVAKIFVDAFRFFLKQNSSESNKLAKLYLKDNLYHNIAKFNPRQQSLMLLQQDLFVMQTTTVFRNLEEERIWCIDQQVKHIFNAQSMYAMALKEDVPWRQWTKWIRDKIVTYLKNNNKCVITEGSRVCIHPTITATQPEHDHHYSIPVTSYENFKTEKGDEECLVM